MTWNDPKLRQIVYQLVTFSVVVFAAWFLFTETQSNLAKQNIASGFSFLKSEAGFEIGESLLSYAPDHSYARALYVGFFNTLKVAFIGNIFALILGVILGICRLSKNYLLSQVSKGYIEVARNTPLLLQLFFWYAVITETLPSVRGALNPFGSIFLSNRGVFFPIFKSHPTWTYVGFSLLISIVLCFVVRYFSKKKQEETGKELPVFFVSLALLIGIPLLTWLIGGYPMELNSPSLKGFNFSGGYSFSPEFSALLLGLVVYTSAFNAEIVRSGIESVDKGQWEAADSLGLSRTRTMSLIILPQALRVIVPPITSQILNLTKNSSLAVAIGYPDFVSVANTTMNQTGQAVEMVALIMLCYLFFSLTTSFVMNLYNKSVALKER